MTSRIRSFLSALVVSGAAVLLPWDVSARAETRDASTVALGWQTENADEIVVGSVVPAAPGDAGLPGDDHGDVVDVRIGQSLKGTLEIGATVRVRLDAHGLGAPWRLHADHLVFLRRDGPVGTVPATYVPVSGAFSVRAIEPGSAEARFPALVLALREALDAQDPEPLRTLLVTMLDDADPGVAWSGATDLVRHAELHGTLTAADSARIVGAYRRQPIGKSTKAALAMACAATRTLEATRALVDSLLLAEAVRIRGPVSEALRRMESADAELLLAGHLADAKPEQQRALLGALAAVGARDAAPALLRLLPSDDAPVRIEAAAALGGMARNLRDVDAHARLGVQAALAARVVGAAADTLPENEVRAVLWSLAQLDEDGAFDAIRTAAATAARPGVREWAARLVAQPRQSLVLLRE